MINKINNNDTPKKTKSTIKITKRADNVDRENQNKTPLLASDFQTPGKLDGNCKGEMILFLNYFSCLLFIKNLN